MMVALLSTLISVSAFAATPTTTTSNTPTAPVAAPAPQADGKVHFQSWPAFDQVTQPLQVLTLEKARPELYTAEVFYSIAPDVKFAETTTWKTAYVAQYERPRLAEWLQCVQFDTEAHTCASLLNISFKSFKSKEKELRKVTKANFEKAKTLRAVNAGATFINGARYDLPLAYGQLLHEVNSILPTEKQLTGMSKYEVTKLYAIGNTEGFGVRDIALEREFVRWVPNLQVEVVSPASTKGMEILTAAKAERIPAYIFDKSSAKNSAIQKLTVAGRAKIGSTGYPVFDLKSGGTEIRLGTQEIPNQLDLWVMSECPYGVKAEESYQAAVAQGLVKPGMKINLRYIASERTVSGKTTWTALHGEPELTENMRQLAIQKTWPETFWKYLEVRNQDLKGDWKVAATAVGLNPEEVEKKMPLGRKLMAQDIKDGSMLKVTGSPTYLWQNRFVLNTPEEFKTAIGYNPNEVTRKPSSAPKAPKTQAAAPAGAKCG